MSNRQNNSHAAPARQAEAAAAAVQKLQEFGVRGVLLQMARDGQIIDVRCEMPQCYCFRGRSQLRSEIAECRLVADGRPLPEAQSSTEGISPPTTSGSRIGVCNQRDYLWRMRINAMLGKRMSLEDIADGAECQEGSRDPRHEPVDGCRCSKGDSFPRSARSGLEAASHSQWTEERGPSNPTSSSGLRTWPNKKRAVRRRPASK